MMKIIFGGRDSHDTERPAKTGTSQPQHEWNSQQHTVAQDMIAGFGAGFVAVALGFPLDVIKTRLQTSLQTSQKEGKSIYKTTRSIVRNEGVVGLYKGLASPLLTLSFSSSISFTSYGRFREIYRAQPGWHIGNYLAGLSCGPIIGVISTVENHIRTQMQMDNVNKNRFRNSVHCVTSIAKKHGVPTLFTGWGITTLKDCSYFSTYFFVYEGVKGTLLRDDLDLHFIHNIKPQAAVPLAGASAGTAAWLVSYPLDCVRAGVQGQSIERGRTPTGWQVFQNLLESRGARGLFMGVTPTLVRASLVHSVRFSAYETFIWLFRRFSDSSSTTQAAVPPPQTKTSIFDFLIPKY